jgi:hypothetical protein
MPSFYSRVILTTNKLHDQHLSLLKLNSRLLICPVDN